MSGETPVCGVCACLEESKLEPAHRDILKQRIIALCAGKSRDVPPQFQKYLNKPAAFCDAHFNDLRAEATS